MSVISKTRKNIFFLIILSLIGIAGLFFATECGIGLLPDSTIYICAARNILNGRGISVVSEHEELVALTHYPPLYPILLAIIGSFGIDPLYGARGISLFFFGANIMLVGIVIYRYTQKSLCFSIWGSFLMMTSFCMLNIHLIAYSEPPFIFFSILGLFLLSLYLEKSTMIFLVISAIMVSFAFLTRYVGIVLIITCGLGILLLSNKKHHQRIIDSAIFILISSVPMIIWLVRNLVIGGTASNRQIVFHPIKTYYFELALSTLSEWLFPFGVSETITYPFSILLIISTMVIYGLIIKKEITNRNISIMPFNLFIFILIYFIFLVFSISFFDPTTPLDNRILSPVYVSGLIILLHIFHKLFSIKWIYMQFCKVAFTVICVIYSIYYFIYAITWIIIRHDDGIGYASRVWKQSEIIQEVKKIPPQIPIYSNGPDVIYILTGRTSGMLPAKLNYSTTKPNENYLSHLKLMEKKLKDKNGFIVYFDKIDTRGGYYISNIELEKIFHLILFKRVDDGSIYSFHKW